MHNNHNFFTFDIIFKLVVCLVTLYICIGYGFYGVSRPKYDYVSPNFIKQQGNIIAQPFMEVFENGKVTQFYNWENIDKSEIEKRTEPLSIRSKSEQYREYGKTSYKNLFGDLGMIQEAALISPQNYSGKWSLVYCSTRTNFCQKNNLKYTGTVKILVDGEVELWGISSNENYIQLKLDKYINRKEYPVVLFI